MSRQDYLAFAKIFADTLADIREHTHNHSGQSTDSELASMLIRICEELSELFATDNERFDHDKFMKACGWNHTPSETNHWRTAYGW